MPRRALLTVVTGALALAVACHSGGSDSGPREAGSVTAVSGTVTAVRGAEGSAARTLAVDDVVFSDDTITTETGAVVTIALSHNGAQWTLGGDTARRIDRSAAWRAPEGSTETTFVTGDPDRTASAGRHTEATPEIKREAETVEVMPRADPPPAPAATTAKPPPPPKEKQRVERHRKKEKMRKKKSEGPPDDSFKKAPLDGLFDDEVEDDEQKLTRDEIVRGIKKVEPAVRKCGETHGVKNVVVKVTILIAKDGSVSGALPMGDHAKTALGRCVATKVRAARFRRNAGPPKVIYPFKL